MCPERVTMTVRGIPGGNSAPDADVVSGREVRTRVL